MLILSVLAVVSFAGCTKTGQSGSSDTNADSANISFTSSQIVSAESASTDNSSLGIAQAADSKAVSGSTQLDETLSMANDLKSTLSSLDDVTASDLSIPTP